MGVLLDFEGEKAHLICSFMRVLSHFKRNLEQMLRDLMEEAEKWDLLAKSAGLRWTSTYEPEERCDLSIDTKTGRHRFPFKEMFKILGCAVSRQGRTQDAIEERMQSANKAYWIYIYIYIYILINK